MELITTHTHTCFTNHGEGTVEELVSAAVAAGVSTIAVTEHYPMTATFDPDRYLSMPAERMGEYLAAVEAAREAHPEIEVLVGCEMDWLGDDEDRVITAEDVAPFQLILGSVHLVDRWPFDDPAQRGRWDEVGADPIWRRYFEVWCEAVSSDAPFHVMSHPDLAKKFGFYPSFDPQPLYEQAAEACAAAGRMVEVNTSGSYYACKEMFPAPALLAAFCRAGVPCTVGTDAHVPANVARDIEKAYRLMYEAGYRTVTVPTADGESLVRTRAKEPRHGCSEEEPEGFQGSGRFGAPCVGVAFQACHGGHHRRARARAVGRVPGCRRRAVGSHRHVGGRSGAPDHGCGRRARPDGRSY